MPDYQYLIVGGGMAGDAAVRGIREADPSGSVGVLGAEPDPPYNRPPLTKGLWKGQQKAEIWRGTPDLGATLHLGRSARMIDPAGRRVTDDQGTTYSYTRLLLATGGTPKRLDISDANVIYYRTYRDYTQLRALTETGSRFAVIGGGFIGSEIAAALAMNGKTVTMLIRGTGIGARTFPAGLSSFLNQYYAEKGVGIVIGETVRAVRQAGGLTRVATSGGRTVDADGVVAGIGIRPNTDLAAAAGLTVEDGIIVDQHLRTSQHDVYAAGDAARFFNPALGEHLRVEHEDNANTMGQAAGRNMAGQAVTYDHLPFFYSDLFDLGYEAVGDLDARLTLVEDWKTPHREGVVYYLRDGRVRGVLLWNVWDQVDHARALIAESGPFDAGALRGRLPA
ncbi:MAG TPA: FAD-dependent oxidoreductase [bacterium]|jgi:NADPH-dependent 2,4-dienoyl-CoA reductase/sulfur reductase-like enzyme